MVDKSFVSLEQRICLVCGVAFDTGALLLDKRLRQTLEHHTATGWGLCTEHQQRFDDGFVALVECDPARSQASVGDVMEPGQAFRTGQVAHVKRALFHELFAVTIKDNVPIVYVELGIIAAIEKLMKPASD
jgi:hypothetical protein